MPSYYKLPDNSAAITQVIKPAGGPDKYKLFDITGDNWFDDLPNGAIEISEADYRNLADAIQIQYARSL